MSVYQAPSEDMQFVVNELVGLEEIQRLPGCEEVSADLVGAIVEEAGKFATGVLDPLNWPGDQAEPNWKITRLRQRLVLQKRTNNSLKPVGEDWLMIRNGVVKDCRIRWEF